MRRLHIRDGAPYCLIDLVLDEDIYRKAGPRFRRYPVIPVMEALGALEAVAARQQLTIRSADVDEARHLSIEPGAPVADVRRTIVDRSGTVVYAAVVLYPSRTVRLDMNLVTD
jgi:GntR family transcriptional regulator